MEIATLGKLRPRSSDLQLFLLARTTESSAILVKLGKPSWRALSVARCEGPLQVFSQTEYFFDWRIHSFCCAVLTPRHSALLSSPCALKGSAAFGQGLHADIQLNGSCEENNIHMKVFSIVRPTSSSSWGKSEEFVILSKMLHFVWTSVSGYGIPKHVFFSEAILFFPSLEATIDLDIRRSGRILMAHDLHCTCIRRIRRFHAEQGLFSNPQAKGQEQQNASFRKQVASYPPAIKGLHVQTACGAWLARQSPLFGNRFSSRIGQTRKQLPLP